MGFRLTFIADLHLSGEKRRTNEVYRTEFHQIYQFKTKLHQPRKRSAINL